VFLSQVCATRLPCVGRFRHLTTNAREPATSCKRRDPRQAQWPSASSLQKRPRTDTEPFPAIFGVSGPCCRDRPRGVCHNFRGLVCTIMSSASTEGGDVPADASSGPSRPRPIRYISPAALNLHRVYEQNRQRLQKKDGAKVPDPTMPQTKGKPRLLLMGQRR
jgi:hypothetical protein